MLGLCPQISLATPSQTLLLLLKLRGPNNMVSTRECQKLAVIFLPNS
jgi:hypothetical protein